MTFNPTLLFDDGIVTNDFLPYSWFSGNDELLVSCAILPLNHSERIDGAKPLPSSVAIFPGAMVINQDGPMGVAIAIDPFQVVGVELFSFKWKKSDDSNQSS